MTSDSPAYRKGLLLVVFCATLWAMTPLIVMFVSLKMDAHTQNAFRYFSGGLVMFALSYSLFRADLKATLKAWPHLLGALFFLVIYQTFSVMAVSLLLPTTAVLVSKSCVIWAIVISIFIFPEERAYIRQPLYLCGTILALAGVVGVVLLRNGLGSGRINLGMAYGLLGALNWSLYNAYTQKYLRRYNPAAFTPLLFLAAGLVFLLMSVAWGRPQSLLTAGFPVLAVLVVSGVLSIGVAQVIYYNAIRQTGVAMASGVTLLTPFLTAAASYFLFADRLSLWQILSGLILIGGIYATTLSKNQPASSPASPPAPENTASTAS